MNSQQMPQMPSLPQQNQSSSAEVKASEVPFTEGSVEKSAGPEVELNTPFHQESSPVADEFQVPQANVNVQEPSNEMKMPQPVAKRGIPVVATRKGFYNQNRYKEGDKFSIRSEEEFGEWFKCVDPAMEAKRVKFLKDKLIKLKAK